MRKRKWHYVMKPHQYEMHCDKCEGTNIDWSEFEGKIWCFDCKIDTDGFPGIFGGPIPWGAAHLLGLRFERWDMKRQIVTYPRIVGKRMKWFAKPSPKGVFA